MNRSKDETNVRVRNQGLRAFGQVQAQLLAYIKGKGVGGAVRQATNKATAVTINKPTGSITTNNASLAGAATVSFTVNNDQVKANDVVNVSVKSGADTGLYTAQVTAVADGSFQVSLTNIGSTASEVVVVNYAVIGGSVN